MRQAELKSKWQHYNSLASLTSGCFLEGSRCSGLFFKLCDAHSLQAELWPAGSHELDPLTNGKVAERGLDARLLLVTPTQVERRQKENLIRVHLFFFKVISHLCLPNTWDSSTPLKTYKLKVGRASVRAERRTAADTARGKCSLSGHSCRGGAAVSGRHFHNTTLKLTQHSNNPTIISLTVCYFKYMSRYARLVQRKLVSLSCLTFLCVMSPYFPGNVNENHLCYYVFYLIVFFLWISRNTRDK